MIEVLKALIEDLRLNHEYCPKEVILQAADELERLSQRTWIGLTDEEIEQSYETTGHYQKLRLQDKFAVYALAKAIEAKLKEKNT